MTERENALRIITKSGEPEWIPYGPDCFDVIIPSNVIKERPTFQEGNGNDWFNCYWHFDPATVGFCPVPGKQPVTDITKWREQVQFPDISSADWKEGTKISLENVNREERLSYLFLESGPWERLHALIGFQETLEALYMEPESLQELLEAITDYKVSLIEPMAEYYKPDIVCSFDDFAFQKSLFMSQDMFRKFLLPCEKRIGDELKKHNIIYSHHSCGKIDSLMGDILDAGPSMILGLWAPYNDMDTVEKQYAHRFTVHGGLDNQLLAREDVEDELIIKDIRRLIDQCAPYKNLIVDPGFLGDPIRAELVSDEAHSYSENYWKRHGIK